MPKLWIWDNGDSAILDMPPLGNGQWVDNCKFCGDVPTVIHTKTGSYIFCVNTDCINNKQYPIEKWNQKIDGIDKKKYLDDDGDHCPYCGSLYLTGEPTNISNGVLSQEIQCSECEKTWLDLYTLTDIEEV